MCVILRVRVFLKGTVDDNVLRFDNLPGGHREVLHLHGMSPKGFYFPTRQIIFSLKGHFNLKRQCYSLYYVMALYFNYHNSVNCDRPGECNPEKDCLRCRFPVHLTVMMTSAQVVETSVNVISNSPSQDYTHPDDHNLPNYDMTPGFKPFTVLL